MYALLIVDDEPYAADGLFTYFQKITSPELNVMRAYSPEQALKLAYGRIDILVTDITMPGMDGFELQTRLLAKWPRMKAIFLTGNQTLDYAQKAIRHHSFVDYVLKTEEFAAVSRAVVKAIDLLETEIRKEDVLRNLRARVKQALPILRKEFFMSLLLPGTTMNGTTDNLRELELDLDEEGDVLLLVGRRDPASGAAPVSSQALYLAVDNIFSEYLTDCIRWYCVSTDPRTIVWVIQPKQCRWEEAGVETIPYIFSNLELIQASCMKLIGESLSFILASAACPWRELSAKYSRFAAMLQKTRTVSQMLVLEQATNAETTGLDIGAFQSLLIQADSISTCLADGDLQALSNLMQRIVPHFSGCSLAQLRELSNVLNLALTRAINLLQSPEGVFQSIRLPTVETEGRVADPHELGRQYTQIADVLAPMLPAEANRAQLLIQEVNRYVVEHLGHDLSLSFMADRVYHSPSYFSRLYKDVSGVSYTNFVIQKRMEWAADLILHSSLKVADIAKRVQYDSVSYFIKAFKKAYGCTPLEYRKQTSETSDTVK